MSANIKLLIMTFLTAMLLPVPWPARACTVDYPGDPSAWVSVPVLLKYSVNSPLQKANRSSCEWVVSLQKGRPRAALHLGGRLPERALPFQITPSRTFHGMRYAIQVDDGWLVGFNRGEWGGTLWWFSSNGATHYNVSYDRVSGFINTPAGLLALEGLAHQGISKGRIIRLIRKDGRWHSETFAPLGDAPETAALDTNGALIVVGARKVFRVRPTGQTEVLLKDTPFGSLYPNSMVQKRAGEFYIGMRGFVVRIHISKSHARLDWLLPRQGFLDSVPSELAR